VPLKHCWCSALPLLHTTSVSIFERSHDKRQRHCRLGIFQDTNARDRRRLVRHSPVTRIIHWHPAKDGVAVSTRSSV
jgi:hypothetical protein